MSVFLWFIGFLVALYIIWLVVKTAVAIHVPLEISGRTLLKQELSKRGINPHLVPVECLDDFVQFAQKIASVREGPSGLAFRAEFVRVIETVADVFLIWKENPQDLTFKQLGNEQNVYQKIFDKHGYK